MDHPNQTANSLRYRLEDLLVGATPEATQAVFVWDEGKDDRGIEEQSPQPSSNL
jgi:hypothetical protein